MKMRSMPRRDFNHDVLKYRWTRVIIDTDRFFDTHFKLRCVHKISNSTTIVYIYRALYIRNK